MTTQSDILLLISKSIGFSALSVVHRKSPGKTISVFTIDDRKDTRSNYQQITSYCQMNNILCITVKDKKMFARLSASLQADTCFVAGWYWLIPQDLLSKYKNGIVGIHHSLLPKYRGGAPLVWAIINGETTVGSSIFYLRNGIDNGPVIAQAKMSISPESYIGEIATELEKKITHRLEEVVHTIIDGSASTQIQDESQATYVPQRKPTDGEIDWTQNSKEVLNFIRAQSRPYPGAYSIHEGRKLTIWKARASSALHGIDKNPGEIVSQSTEELVIRCTDGMICIYEWSSGTIQC